MIDSLQLIDKDRLGILDITESNRALAEESVVHLCVYHLVDQVSNGLFRVFRH